MTAIGKAESAAHWGYQTPLNLTELPLEIMEKVFMRCVFPRDHSALSLVSTHFYFFVTSCAIVSPHAIEYPGFAVVDTKGLPGVTEDPNVRVSKLVVLKLLKRLSPQVDGEVGLSIVIKHKGLTVNTCVRMMKGMGVSVGGCGTEEALKEFGDQPLLETECDLVTNNVFKDTRAKCHCVHKKLVQARGCEMLTLLDGSALCGLTMWDRGVSFYGQGKGSWDYTYSTTAEVSRAFINSNFSCWHREQAVTFGGSYYATNRKRFYIQTIEGVKSTEYGAGGRVRLYTTSNGPTQLAELAEELVYPDEYSNEISSDSED